jgi:hypothetical protein
LCKIVATSVSISQSKHTLRPKFTCTSRCSFHQTCPHECIAAFVFCRRPLHHCSYPPPSSLQIFINRNLGMLSADPLRISPGLRIVIFQQGNKGGKPVIGRLIMPCASASIFRHCCATAAICHFLWWWQWGWWWQRALQWGWHWRWQRW